MSYMKDAAIEAHNAMTLTDLVPSLEVCKELQEAGFPQNTAMVWTGMMTVTPNDMSGGWSHGGTVTPHYLAGRADDIAAPTTEEILKELPPTIMRNELSYYLEVQITPAWGWDVDWTDDDGTYLEPRGETTCWQSVVLAAAKAYLWWRKVKHE